MEAHRSATRLAFISDDVVEMQDDDVLALARAALVHTDNTATILRRFLRKYDHASTAQTGGEK